MAWKLAQSADQMPSLDGASGWLNSPPLTSAGLRGQVVIVQFWTYTCINWIRSLPYVRAWEERYREAGLVVIGVHTPEFQVEHDTDNVRRAAASMRVRYPIALDNDYAVWTAFGNRFWPALYLVDASGAVRHEYFGEGDYEHSEQILRQLLSEAGADVGDDLAKVAPDEVERPANWRDLGSPETYLGYGQTAGFASPGGLLPGEPRGYRLPEQLSLNEWALAGSWRVEREAAVLGAGDGAIRIRFHARDVHLVMGARDRGGGVRFRAALDGRPPGADHGLDVAEDGAGIAAEPRLYQLIRQRGPIGERTLELTFPDDGGIHAYVFTFG